MPLRTAALAFLVSVAIAAGAWTSWWWAPANRLNRAVAALSTASRTARFTPGRLGIDREWAATVEQTRGASAAIPSLDVLDAAVTIDHLTRGASGRASLHARALAALASNQLDLAIDDLRSALAVPGSSAAAIRSDLSAALLERARRQNEPTDAVDALDQAGLALAETATLPAPLFNQAMALAALGPRRLAVEAWERYLAQDGSSRWAEEARRHLAAVRARPDDPRAGTTRRLHDLELRLLPEWARHTVAGASVEVAPIAAAVTAIAAETGDREAVELGTAAIRAGAGPSGARMCLAQAILALGEWRSAYERGTPIPAQQAALAAELALGCAHLPTVGARLRFTLAGDRNATYQALGHLASDAAGRRYDRIASLARIARGISAMRRAELTAGMADLQAARAMAYGAGDLELTAAADAMMADGYRELGDQSSAWRSLQLALENLPAVVSGRLTYSIVRAAADAALDQDRSAASLPYSRLLIEATAQWAQPGPRILAYLDRADALRMTGAITDASASIEAGRALVPQVEDQALRAEWDAEVRLARGRLAELTAPAAAVPALSEALTFFEQHQTTVRVAAVLLERGRAYRALGDTRGAREDWNAAASLIEDQQPQVRDRQLRISRFSALWDVFAELVRVDRSDPAAALASSERARARELLDSLAPHQRSAALAGAALWNWLPPGASALVFSSLPEQMLVWTVDRNGPRLREIPIASTAVDQMVRRAVAAISEGRDDAVDEISSLLLQGLPPGSPDRPLLIVPDGALHFLPFAALKLPGSQTRLIEAWTPVVAPSLSVARWLAAQPVPTRPSGPPLLIGYQGDAASGLPVLRGVEPELDVLHRVYGRATVLRGAEATPDALVRLAPASRLIHIAAHGIVNTAYPNRSHLLLAPGEGDQALTPARIAAMTLPGAVVVLSACDTATGRVYRGEGPASLARPFLIAGATAVIAAQMPVSDDTAPSFDADLAVRLNGGMPGPTALAVTQRLWLSRRAPARDWSVFSAIGSIASPLAPSIGKDSHGQGNH